MFSAVASHNYTNAGSLLYRIPESQRQEESGRATSVRYSQTLIGQVARGWVLVAPITLTIERDEDGAFLASETVTSVYGYGQSGPEAIRDYIESLIEYFEIVSGATGFESLALADQLGRYLVRA